MITGGFLADEGMARKKIYVYKESKAACKESSVR